MMNKKLSYNDLEWLCEKIKPKNMKKVNDEWKKLVDIPDFELFSLNGRSKLGCNIVDHYFFSERLATVGNKGINFIDFLNNVEYYKGKKYIQTLIDFCKKNNRYKDCEIKKWYYIYGLCFGRINAFKITNAQQIYRKYKPTKILDPFAGFGGRMIGAILENIDYMGYDKNIHLKSGYEVFFEDFKEKYTSFANIRFEDSKEISYKTVSESFAYDMVFTSPPYKNIEVYRCCEKMNPEEWKEMYTTVFSNSWEYLKDGGYYIININSDIYNSILIPLLGECIESILLTKTKKNSYDEFIYIWKKQNKQL